MLDAPHTGAGSTLGLMSPIRLIPVRLFAALLIAAASVLVAAWEGHAQQSPNSPPAATGSWWDRAPVVTSRYYRIKSDLPQEQLKPLVEHLDRTFEAYVGLLGNLRQNLPASFDVLIFAQRADYVATLGNQYAVNGQGSGGMFFSNPRGSALALWTENLPIRRVHHVIQHEGFHQVAFALFGGNLSPWVNEGLAEFFGEAAMVNGKLVLGQTNPRVLRSVQDAIEKKTYIPFRQMVQMDGATWNAAVQNGSAKVQYEQAWSMVHFLVYGDGGRYDAMFGQYLRLLNAGYNPYESFVRAFRSDDLEDFERKWAAFMSQARPSAFTTAMERTEFLAAGLLELSRRKVYPKTIDELRDRLRSIQFTYTMTQHGINTVLSAEDDALFTVPTDDLTKKDAAPAFKITETSMRGVKPKELRLNRDNPFPPTLTTVDLAPNNLQVRWVRNMDTNEFTFAIEVVR